MAFLGIGKKKESNAETTATGGREIPPPPEIRSEVPIDAVIQMRQQGLTNNQIIQSLQRQGNTSDQIFEAMSQADVKGGVEAVPEGNLEPMGAIENPIQTPQPEQYQQYPTESEGDYYRQYQDMIEHMAEEIINEKWTEITKDMTRITEWKDQTEAKLNKMEQSIQDLKNSFDKLQEALVGKISEYDKNILNVGTEIKAMEKVFQKIMPQFTENVNELSRISKKKK